MKIGILCGFRSGNLPSLTDDTQKLSSQLARNGATIVYGGSQGGLMGKVADGVIAANGELVGITTDYYVNSEGVHPQLSQVIIEKDLGARKEKIAHYCDVIIALPGGLGTVDELLEIWKRKQHKEVNCKLVVLNSHNFFDSLLHFIQHMAHSEFLEAEVANDIIVAESIDDIVSHLFHSI